MHQRCNEKVLLSQLPDVPILNIMGRLSKQDREKVYTIDEELRHFEKELKSDRTEDISKAIVALGLSQYKINRKNLLEHLHHLNNYQNYDSTDVEMRVTKNATVYEIMWHKNGNSVVHVLYPNGLKQESWLLWDDMYLMFRKGGPSAVVWHNDKIMTRTWDQINHPGRTQDTQPYRSSNPIVGWEKLKW